MTILRCRAIAADERPVATAENAVSTTEFDAAWACAGEAERDRARLRLAAVRRSDDLAA